MSWSEASVCQWDGLDGAFNIIVTVASYGSRAV